MDGAVKNSACLQVSLSVPPEVGTGCSGDNCRAEEELFPEQLLHFPAPPAREGAQALSTSSAALALFWFWKVVALVQPGPASP